MRKKTWMGAVGLLAAASLLLGGAAAGAGGADGDAPPSAPPGAQAGDAATFQDDMAGDITFSVPSGTFSDEVSVSLSTDIEGAEIRYTTTGEVPTASSSVYDGEPLLFTATTQLRAQAFVDGAATGETGTALYVASTVTTSHDMPLLVMDAYGAGKPGREYQDVATMIMEPQDGAASVADAPTLATRAGFHLRGQSSSSFPKAPYRLELWDNEDDDLDHPVLGMPADSDWVLRGPYSDKSLIREALVYDLGRELGLAAPRYRFVEVYLNLDDGVMTADDYQGVYMIVEKIKINKDRLDLAELEEEDITPPAVTGGYVFAFEWLASEEPTLPCTGDQATCWRDLEVKEPDGLEPEQLDWLTGHLQEFHDALHGDAPDDPESGYPAYLDVGSFVDHVILNELSREMDGYIRSTYFHKDREGPIVAGPLWDYDLTFGVGGFFENQETAGWQFEQLRQPAGSDWYLRLMNIPGFAEQVDARWQELRQTVLSDDALNARVTALAEPLTNAAERNFEKWPILSSQRVGAFVTQPSDTWQEQVEFLRDWMVERAAWLDTSGWQHDADEDLQ